MADPAVGYIQGPEGPRGRQGPKGDPGPPGDRGPKGPQGDKGDKGDPGPQGLRGLSGDKGDLGPQGDQGIAGPAGTRGLQGDKGSTGDTGPKGDQGIQGVEGPRGFRGDKGDQGERGLQGFSGTKGDQGIQGVEGPRGFRGTKGDPGVNGAKGESGDRGPKGDKGDAGIPGTKGDQGIQGNPGPVGPKGPLGTRGTKGDQGIQGVRGPRGIQGLKGDPGPKGGPGEAGIPGAKGDKGDPGLRGEQGLQGVPGVPGPPGGSDVPVPFWLADAADAPLGSVILDAGSASDDPGIGNGVLETWDLDSLPLRVQRFTAIDQFGSQIRFRWNGTWQSWRNTTAVDSTGSISIPADVATKGYVDDRFSGMPLVMNVDEAPDGWCLAITESVGNPVGDTTLVQTISQPVSHWGGKYRFQIATTENTKQSWVRREFEGSWSGWSEKRGSLTTLGESGPAFDGSGWLDMHNRGIYSLPAPTDSSHATNKDYVDGAVARAFTSLPWAPDLDPIHDSGFWLANSGSANWPTIAGGSAEAVLQVINYAPQAPWGRTQILRMVITGKEYQRGGAGDGSWNTWFEVDALPTDVVRRESWGGLDLHGNAVIGVRAPTDPDHAANKGYVDDTIANADVWAPKPAVDFNDAPDGVVFMDSGVPAANAPEDGTLDGQVLTISKYLTAENGNVNEWRLQTVVAMPWAGTTAQTFMREKWLGEWTPWGATPAATKSHYFLANIGGGDGSVVWTGGPGFLTVPLLGKDTTDWDKWDADQSIWTIPESGLYSIDASVRVPDGYGAGLNVGIGVGTSNTDSPAFHWHGTTNSMRQTFGYSRAQHFNAGDPVRLFTYMDGGTGRVSGAELVIALIARD